MITQKIPPLTASKQSVLKHSFTHMDVLQTRASDWGGNKGFADTGLV